MGSQLKAHAIVNVQAYKHDGKLYRQWNGAKVLEVSPDTYVLLMYKTKVKELNGQQWKVREPVLWFMPRDRFFNTTALIRKSGTFFYTNLASPPLFEDNTIKFIDYDLDVKAYPGQKVKLVDQKEYEEHKIKYNYSEKLKQIISMTVKEVLKLIKDKEEFFDEYVIETYIKELVSSKDFPKKLLRIKWD